MKIILNPDKEIADAVKEAVKKNGGYCPCRLDKTPETKCMCKEFREQDEGLCHCGLYIKIKGEKNNEKDQDQVSQ